MKENVVSSLMIAKSLFSQSQSIAYANDKYSTSAALVILQDAVELTFLSCLLEMGVDEVASLENYSFDQIIGELKKQGINVPHSGTLKAMNKQRVIVKHYGKVADPVAVIEYIKRSRASVDIVLKQIGIPTFGSIHLGEIVADSVSKNHIDSASKFIEDKEYWSGLIEIRKAIFEEIEYAYCIDDVVENIDKGMSFLISRGYKAPYYVRNKDWIENNVKNWFDYIQIDHNTMRMDLLEWGVPTELFWNIWRLTPKVFKEKDSAVWYIERDVNKFNNISEETARYCLDTAIELIVGKWRHMRQSRTVDWRGKLVVEIVAESSLLMRADKAANIERKLLVGEQYEIDAIITGFDRKTDYVHISELRTEPLEFLSGYVELDSVKILE